MTDAPPLPTGEFDVLYADPPWSYEQDTPRGGVAHHYPTMDLSDIKGMDVPAAEDAVLYLWATVTHAAEALEVLRNWGFSYKTQAVWDKQSYGVGHWFRGGHELLYLGVRGDVSPPDPEVRRSSVFRAVSGQHSTKPDRVRAYIERAHPDTNRLELFARDNIAGWTNWGNDVPETEQQTADRYNLL